MLTFNTVYVNIVSINVCTFIRYIILYIIDWKENLKRDRGIEVKIDVQIRFDNLFIKFIKNLIFTPAEQKDRI